MAAYVESIDISAPAETVSGILHDLNGWTGWTSTVQEATPLGSAVVRPGTRVRVRQPGLPVSVWTVDVAEPTAFEWNNLRHGLRTVARHRIADTPQGSTLSVTIEQEGLLAPAVDLVYGRIIRRHLRQMTEELKLAAESAARTEPLDLDRGRVDAHSDQQLGRRLGESR
ncbi:MAG: hypothetical protein QOJ11_1263 [Frankiales bacterium]|jgi:hypothetical protein|nr:hypothetical protein [Frankiales bacterium]